MWEREREREREREKLFCEGKVCKEWKREWQIYSKSVWIRNDQKRKMKGKMKSDVKVEVVGRWKGKG